MNRAPNYLLLSLTPDAPPGFQWREELSPGDLNRGPFALFADSVQAAEAAIAPHKVRVAGVLVTPGDSLRFEQQELDLYHLRVPPHLRADLREIVLSYLDFLESFSEVSNAKEEQSIALALSEADRVRLAREFGGLREELLRERIERRATEEELKRERRDLAERVHERTAQLARTNAALQTEVAERHLASEELDRFFTLSLDLLCIADFEGHFKRVNPAWMKTLGYSEEELTARPFLDFVHPDDRESTLREAAKLSLGDISICFQNRYQCKDGSYRWLLWNSASWSEKKLIYAAASDITEQRKAEESLGRSRSFLDSIVENIPNMIFVKDAKELRFVRFNRAGEELLGQPRASLIGKNDYDFFPREEAEWFIKKDRTVLEASGVTDIPEETIHTANGVLVLHTKKIPIFDEAGKPQYLLGISEDITERKRAEAEIQRAKEAAEAANRAKSEFLANMSHELRTPMNAIIGFSEILQDQTFGELNPRQTKYIANILTSGRHLLQLINDILDLAKIEAKRLELDLAPFAVASALQDVATIVKALAYKKNIALEVSAAPELPLLVADQPKFKQIMYNLLSNAIKFTPDGGHVGVEVRLEEVRLDEKNTPRFLRFSVSDTGIGIRPEDQERVFAEFEQVDSSFSRRHQGTGLGLALTKRLVELHGGHIRVESQGIEGQGSTFFFVLPVEARTASQDELHAHGSNDGDDDNASEEIEDASVKHGRTILVVEDNHPASELLTHYLAEAGYHVVHAFDGEQALQMVRDLHPDAVTLDIMLPHKDGWEVLAELKSQAATADVPVVIISMTDDRQLGFSLGATEFLTKPIDKNRLLETVSRVVALRGDSRVVLVVDDEPKTVEMLSDLLRHHDFSVLQAFSGREGIDMTIEKKPDLIILDLMMPEVNGFLVVQRLREHPSAREIPILIFTAKDITDEDRRLLNSDIQAIVPKSGKEDLLRELEKLTGARSAS